MNTKFLLSPAYLFSIAMLLFGAVLSGGRFMLIGWILCAVGVALNAITLVVLTNREQIYALESRESRPPLTTFTESTPVVQRVDSKPAVTPESETPSAEGQSAEPSETAR